MAKVDLGRSAVHEAKAKSSATFNDRLLYSIIQFRHTLLTPQEWAAGDPPGTKITHLNCPLSGMGPGPPLLKCAVTTDGVPAELNGSEFVEAGRR